MPGAGVLLCGSSCAPTPALWLLASPHPGARGPTAPYALEEVPSPEETFGV